MAKKKHNKSEAVRRYAVAYPYATPKQIAEGLAQNGIKVTPNFVRVTIHNTSDEYWHELGWDRWSEQFKLMVQLYDLCDGDKKEADALWDTAKSWRDNHDGEKDAT